MGRVAIDWRHGKGPEVTGAGEALLMAMAGRPSVVDELAGPGAAIVPLPTQLIPASI